MAGLAAVNQLGESLVGLLVSRRNLLSAEGKLGPIPAALDISQLPLSKLASAAAEPTAGLTLTCTRIAMSDHPRPRQPARTVGDGATLALDISYLAIAWGGSGAVDEQSILSWAMLELASRSALDRSVLIGGPDVWRSDEIVQIIPDSISDDALWRLWGALGHRLRLCACFTARVLRIGYGPADDWPNVVATRFGFAPIDDALADA